MTKFDFNRHKLVAVVATDGDAERGQHYHVDMGEFLNEAREYVAQENAAPQVQHIVEPTREVVTVNTKEVIPQEQLDRIDMLANYAKNLDSRLQAAENRLVDVESRPVLSSDDVRQLMDGLNTRFKEMIERHVNGSMGDVKSRLTLVEKRSDSGAVAPSQPQSEQLNRLSVLINDVSDYVKSVEQMVENQSADLNTKYAEIAEHITNTNLEAIRIKRWMHNLTSALNYEDKAKEAG